MGVFYDPRTNPDAPNSVFAVAHLSLFADGKRVHLEVTCDDPLMLESAIIAAETQLGDFRIRREIVRDGMVKLRVEGEYSKASQAVKHASNAAAAKFCEAGLKH